MKNVYVRRWCIYDRCCEFDPIVHNQVYCTECKCKRKAENSKKRLTAPLTDDAEVWSLQERKKLNRAYVSQNKNEWILQNKSFAAFDIETSNLSASIGEILCACVKTLNGPIKTFVADTNTGDKQLCIDMRDYLETFDYVYGFYSLKFDLPYLNTRLIIHGERPIDSIRHIDVYYTARHKLKLHSNKLAIVAETLLGHDDKTRVIGPIWLKAIRGDPESIFYIIDHCQRDVKVLEDVFNQLRGFMNLSATRLRKFGAAY